MIHKEKSKIKFNTGSSLLKRPSPFQVSIVYCTDLNGENNLPFSLMIVPPQFYNAASIAFPFTDKKCNESNKNLSFQLETEIIFRVFVTDVLYNSTNKLHIVRDESAFYFTPQNRTQQPPKIFMP